MPHAIVFTYVWPEPRSSAAGVRTRELVAILRMLGWQLTAVSPSAESPHAQELRDRGVATLTADPNTAAAGSALAALPAADLVLYDRFVMEEQFGWRARELWPRALHLVDTQDLHSLRRAREKGKPKPEGEDLLRELSSLYRSDGALVVSDFEAKLLGELDYPFAHHLPFSTTIDESPAPLEARAGFCFLGNFRHPPNLDAVRHLVTEGWSEIRARLPRAELHLYGAYPPAEISAHKGGRGIFAHGPVHDHRAALAKHVALLAPLRFGAGIKGKVLEAFGTGTPVAGSENAFEGLCPVHGDDFVTEAVRLATDAAYWRERQSAGLALVAEKFSRARVERDFLAIVENGRKNLEHLRARNLTGAMLRHHASNATKYFSRWIAAKNAAKT
jgi:glycosyltransferase involved in cell wall biosynthesis